MDVTQIRYFTVIARAGSLARASEALGVTPAALSKSMRLLQEELGFSLLQASGRGITITREGRRFAEKGEAILREVYELSEYAKGKPPHQVLRLGSFEVFTTYFFGQLYEEHMGGQEVMLHELIPGQIEQALIEDRIDIGVSYIPIPHAELEHIKVGKVAMGIFGLKTKFGGMKREELPFAVPIEPMRGVPTKAQGLDGWREEMGSRKIVFRVGMMETALDLCRRGQAVCFLPKFVVELHNGFMSPKYRLEELARAQKAAGEQPVYLVKRRSDTESATFRQIARALRKTL